MVYRPTARVLTVLALLQSHGRMTGAQLARRLEVDMGIPFVVREPAALRETLRRLAAEIAVAASVVPGD